MWRTGGLGKVSLLAGFLIVFALTWSPMLAGIGYAASNETILFGMITSASGEPMEGVVVSARDPWKPLTTSVYTDAAGEYYFPPMESKTYKVWAQAKGFDAGRTEVTLNGSTWRQNFVLKTIEDFALQLSGDELVASLPEDTDHDRKMKEVFRLSCGGCHNQNLALATRYDEHGWTLILSLMSRITTLGWNTSEDRVANPLIDYFKEDLAAWLAKVRGPGPSTMKLTPRPRPQGDETLVVIREYDTPHPGAGLPLYNDGSDWSLGAPDKLDMAHHHNMNATFDFSGNFYFAVDLNNTTFRSFGRTDSKTGKITNFRVLRPNGSSIATTTHDIITDLEGNLWFDLEGRLGKLDPRTDTLETFSPPEGHPVSIWIDNDGKGYIWCSTRGGALRFDPRTKTWKVFRNPTQKTPIGSAMAMYGIAGDGLGNGWWSQVGIDIIVKGIGETGQVEEIRLPRRENPVLDLFTDEERRVFDMMGGNMVTGAGWPWGHAVRKIGADVRGTTVWGPTWFGDNMIRIDSLTDKVTVYPVPWRDGAGYMTVVDEEGMVWTNYTNGDYVAKLDPKTEKWTRYDLPTLGTETHGLEVSTISGRTQVVVPYLAAQKTARLEFRTREELETLKAKVRTERSQP